MLKACFTPLGKNSSSSISSFYGISEEGKAEVAGGGRLKARERGAVTDRPQQILGEFKCRDSADVYDGRNDQAGQTQPINAAILRAPNPTVSFLEARRVKRKAGV